ncbi:hypothetical protein K437DRAFT_147200 [Tilletiaria anomala UBC 951]|uniref:Uncharacterized protein n=1 Tax=Tilletiaria anomala (strain ATCC 24038 / CBS 436.72 / UBC 951) TaxID=1037660 RepID=A0A066VQB3_TILAU|nr:uncharacterized protein K437DRAFT_147200 [Tilletiaria anomala UBC 951]KDN43671.1 hypothetical protein K437DRAFT_147200 [Tilletiaria anomala UBC 951]
MLPFVRQSLAVLASPQQGFDPLRTLSQISSVQALHYLTLVVLVPILLRLFPGVSQEALRGEGGALQIGMLIDWRELAGRPTWDWDPVDRPSISWSVEHKKVQDMYDSASKVDLAAMQAWQVGSVWLDDDTHLHSQPSASSPSTVKLPLVLKPDQLRSEGNLQNGRRDENEQSAEQPASHEREINLERWEWEHTRDSRRGWAIALAWCLSAIVDIHFLAHLIRRPAHILDHVLTLHLLNLLIASLYASSLPTSLFWWLIMTLHATICAIVAERLCIKRELTDGFSSAPPGFARGVGGGAESDARAEEGRVPTARTADLHSDGGLQRGRVPRNDEHRTTNTTHVLFDNEDDEDVGRTSMEGGRTGKSSNANGNGHGNGLYAESYEMKARTEKGGHAD